MIVFFGALCAIATGALAYTAAPICSKLSLMDIPGDRKLHKQETPLLGGLALAIVIMPISFLLFAISSESGSQRSLLLFCLATFSMALIGMADDRHSLSARNRIILAMLVFGSLASFDPIFNVRLLSFAVPEFELGLAIGPIAVVFTVVCCVGLVNAVNMADGKNGLAIGLCLGWLAIIATRSPEGWGMAIVLLCIGLSVLLIFNLYGRIFLGDGGSYGFATAVAIIAIACYNSPGNHAGRAISADELMILFAVPVLDSFRLTFVRLRRGQSPMAADRDHLHHHLQDRFGWPMGLLIYLVLAIGIPAVIIVSRG